jgi:ketosteroid isomerase-like protein
MPDYSFIKNYFMFRKIIPTLLLMAASTTTFAGKPEQQVTQALEQFRQAMINGDSASLAALTLPQLSYGHSGGHVEGQEEFITKLTSGKSDFVTMDISDQNITIIHDVAVVRHNLKATTNDNGVVGNVSLHILLIWQKEKSGWKLLARQAVKAK